MTETDKLLAVLDMSEEEQWEWLEKQNVLQTRCSIELNETTDEWEDIPESFADLAFRLRDEVCHFSPMLEKLFTRGLDTVEGHCNNTYLDGLLWWIIEAKPIHWIIAALIAKKG